MVFSFLTFCFAVLFCQVQSQLCGGPGLLSNPQVVAPQVIAQPVVATTIVDNSVSNALANALQLLIVSDLIESRLGCGPSANTLNGLAPVIDTLDVVTPCVNPVDIVSPCGPVIDSIIPNFYGSVTETFTPNIFGGYTETISANPFGIEAITPNYCGGWREIVPNTCGADIVTTNIGYPNIVTPNFYGGLTEIVTQAPCVQQLPAYGGINEIIAPCGPNFYNGISEVIAPNYYGGGVTEIISPFNPGCVGGYTEIVSGNPFAPNFYGNVDVISPISPCNTAVNLLPEVVTPSFGSFYGGVNEFSPFNVGCFGGVPEIISNPYTPNYFGGLKEFITPSGPISPVAAEVLIPSSIPAQLTCNFGYMPTTVPCVSVNVETLPFEQCGCGCNGYPKIFY